MSKRQRDHISKEIADDIRVLRSCNTNNQRRIALNREINQIKSLYQRYSQTGQPQRQAPIRRRNNVQKQMTVIEKEVEREISVKERKVDLVPYLTNMCYNTAEEIIITTESGLHVLYNQISNRKDLIVAGGRKIFASPITTEANMLATKRKQALSYDFMFQESAQLQNMLQDPGTKCQKFVSLKKQTYSDTLAEWKSLTPSSYVCEYTFPLDLQSLSTKWDVDFFEVYLGDNIARSSSRRIGNPQMFLKKRRVNGKLTEELTPYDDRYTPMLKFGLNNLPYSASVKAVRHILVRGDSGVYKVNKALSGPFPLNDKGEERWVPTRIPLEYKWYVDDNMGKFKQILVRYEIKVNFLELPVDNKPENTIQMLQERFVTVKYWMQALTREKTQPNNLTLANSVSISNEGSQVQLLKKTIELSDNTVLHVNGFTDGLISLIKTPIKLLGKLAIDAVTDIFPVVKPLEGLLDKGLSKVIDLTLDTFTATAVSDSGFEEKASYKAIKVPIIQKIALSKHVGANISAITFPSGSDETSCVKVEVQFPLVIGTWDITTEDDSGRYSTSDGWGSKDLHYNLNGELNEDGSLKLEPVYPCYHHQHDQQIHEHGIVQDHEVVQNPFTCIIEDVKMVRYYTMGHQGNRAGDAATTMYPVYMGVCRLTLRLRGVPGNSISLFIDTKVPLPVDYKDSQGADNTLRISPINEKEFLSGPIFGVSNNNDGRRLEEKTQNSDGVRYQKLIKIDLSKYSGEQDPSSLDYIPKDDVWTVPGIDSKTGEHFFAQTGFRCTYITFTKYGEYKTRGINPTPLTHIWHDFDNFRPSKMHFEDHIAIAGMIQAFFFPDSAAFYTTEYQYADYSHQAEKLGMQAFKEKFMFHNPNMSQYYQEIWDGIWAFSFNNYPCHTGNGELYPNGRKDKKMMLDKKLSNNLQMNLKGGNTQELANINCVFATLASYALDRHIYISDVTSVKQVVDDLLKNSKLTKQQHDFLQLISGKKFITLDEVFRNYEGGPQLNLLIVDEFDNNKYTFAREFDSQSKTCIVCFKTNHMIFGYSRSSHTITYLKENELISLSQLHAPLNGDIQLTNRIQQLDKSYDIDIEADARSLTNLLMSQQSDDDFELVIEKPKRQKIVQQQLSFVDLDEQGDLDVQEQI